MASLPADVEQLKALVLQLQKQLVAAGVDPESATISLEEAKQNLSAAVARLMEGDESAQPEFDKWDRIIAAHPEELERKEKEEAEWEERILSSGKSAKEVLKGFFPDGWWRLTPEKLAACSVDENKRAVGMDLAKRVTRRRVLSFLWLEREYIGGKIHAADLFYKFTFEGLDFREMLAVFASLPSSFENDGDGRKGKWLEGFKQRLKDMDAKSLKGTLTAAQQCAAQYPDSEARKTIKPRRRHSTNSIGGGMASIMNELSANRGVSGASKAQKKALLSGLLSKRTGSTRGLGGSTTSTTSKAEKAEKAEKATSGVAAMLQAQLLQNGVLKAQKPQTKAPPKAKKRRTSVKIKQLADSLKLASKMLKEAEKAQNTKHAAPKKILKEASKDSSKESLKDSTKESLKDSTKESLKVSSKESLKDSSNDTSQDTSKEKPSKTTSHEIKSEDDPTSERVPKASLRSRSSKRKIDVIESKALAKGNSEESVPLWAFKLILGVVFLFAFLLIWSGVSQEQKSQFVTEDPVSKEAPPLQFLFPEKDMGCTGNVMKVGCVYTADDDDDDDDNDDDDDENEDFSSTPGMTNVDADAANVDADIANVEANAAKKESPPKRKKLSRFAAWQQRRKRLQGKN
eukprot:g536.t1